MNQSKGIFSYSSHLSSCKVTWIYIVFMIRKIIIIIITIIVPNLIYKYILRYISSQPAEINHMLVYYLNHICFPFFYSFKSVHIISFTCIKVFFFFFFKKKWSSHLNKILAWIDPPSGIKSFSILVCHLGSWGSLRCSKYIWS
jgi:hypothetical protein